MRTAPRPRWKGEPKTGSRFALVLALVVSPLGVVAACTSFGTAEGGPDAASTVEASTPDAEAEKDAAQPLDGGAPDATATARDLIDAGGFGIDSTEVSNADYDRFLMASLAPGFTPAPHPACDANKSFARASGCAFDTRPEVPVTCVDWCDAWAYCAWEGKRLCGKIGANELAANERTDPTKSQWLNACSGVGGQPLPYGNVVRLDACVTKDNADGGLRPSGSTKTCEGKPKGLFDMVGNASEWEDSCDKSTSQDDPCAARGGSIADPSANATCMSVSSAKRRDARSTLGFRCCSR